MAASQEQIETLQRSFRAKEIARRPNAVRRLTDGTFEVASQCDPSKTYRVTSTSCTCPDYQARQPAPCKHQLVVRYELERERLQRERQRIVIDEWDGRTASRWHFADEPALVAGGSDERAKPERATCKDWGAILPASNRSSRCASCLAEGFAY